MTDARARAALINDIRRIIDQGIVAGETTTTPPTATNSGANASAIALANTDFLNTVVSALATAANETEISPQTASDTAVALARTIVLAKSLDALFDSDAAAGMVRAVSASLGARGVSRPNGAIQAIPSVLKDLARLRREGDTRQPAADDLVHVALASFNSVRPGTWRAAYNASLATVVGNKDASLETPIQVRTSTRIVGVSSWSEQPSAITVVQYSGKRNPFWPIRREHRCSLALHRISGLGAATLGYDCDSYGYGNDREETWATASLPLCRHRGDINGRACSGVA
jgi:hypothetical protein